MRVKKRKTVECSMINLQREIICVAVGFQKVLTGCLFNMFNIFDIFPWLHTDFYKVSVKYNCFKLPLVSPNLPLLPEPGCVLSLQNYVILGAVSMANNWFKHHLRIAVGMVGCGEPLTFFSCLSKFSFQPEQLQWNYVVKSLVTNFINYSFVP